jgi:hypothetical protein
MSLRPRYSLLTLLVLTALVAGGMKWWYGPHHVVEGLGSVFEKEYNYYLDWRGNRVIHGAFVVRLRDKLEARALNILYYRHGEEVPWYYCYVETMANESMDDWLKQPLTKSPLSPVEQLEFQAAIDRELRRFGTSRDGFIFFERQGPQAGVYSNR